MLIKPFDTCAGVHCTCGWPLFASFDRAPFRRGNAIASIAIDKATAYARCGHAPILVTMIPTKFTNIYHNFSSRHISMYMRPIIIEGFLKYGM